MSEDERDELIISALVSYKIELENDANASIGDAKYSRLMTEALQG